MSLFRHHIFVCLNERAAEDSRGSCKPRGSEAVLEAFRAELAARGLKNAVRAQKAGCLDQCALGPAVVIYPEGTWYVGVSPRDVPELVEAMLAGRRVERLLHPAAR